MAVKVMFYSLAPKPAAAGGKSFVDAAAGKAGRGRRWFRLESRPQDVFLFPAGTSEWEVWDWLDAHPAEIRGRVAFTLDGRFHLMSSDAALDAVPGGRAARENAIRFYEDGGSDWAVFVPED